MKTKIDKPLLKSLRQEIDEALKQVAEKHRLHIHAGNCKFDENCASFKLEIAALDDGGQAVTPEVARFDKYAELVGLKAEDRGRSFTYGRKAYTVHGLKEVIDGKAPIICACEGKQYCFPVAVVKSCLSIETAVTSAP